MSQSDDTHSTLSQTHISSDTTQVNDDTQLNDDTQVNDDTKVNDDTPDLDDDSDIRRSKSKTRKRWKLKNADMRILDVFKKTKSGGSVMLVVKMEFTLKNISLQNKTKVAGER